MTMTEGFLTREQILDAQVEDTPGGGVFSTYAEVRSIQGPTFEGAEIDVTNMDSPGRLREFIAGLTDPGQVTFEVNYLPANSLHQQLINDVKANPSVTRAHRLRFAQLTPVRRIDFNAFVLSVPLTIPTDSQVTANVTLRATGDPTLVQE